MIHKYDRLPHYNFVRSLFFVQKFELDIKIMISSDALVCHLSAF